jgi:hypothetical protein
MWQTKIDKVKNWNPWFLAYLRLPELKAQVSFSDRPLSVWTSVCLLDLHFRLLQNRSAQF